MSHDPKPKGVGWIEYLIICALLAVAAVTAIHGLGAQLRGTFKQPDKSPSTLFIERCAKHGGSYTQREANENSVVCLVEGRLIERFPR